VAASADCLELVRHSASHDAPPATGATSRASAGTRQRRAGATDFSWAGWPPSEELLVARRT
jgi:hypothetical protein